ncbi:ABC transporter permease [Catellatospora aurea]|uniref:ABC transporter permease n=1 Tax=Catellatospora aurea TaxID=1337874 RepID=A0ABW2H5K8_9ACTN
MLLYLLRRIVSAISVVLVAIIASFGLFYLAPTDPAGVVCGPKCTPERHAEITANLHLDDPMIQQIFTYVQGLVAGRTYTSAGVTIECAAPCLGYSYILGQPVTTLMAQALPVTVSIVSGSAIAFLLIGTLTGVIAARRRGTSADRAMVGGTLVLGAVPYFVVALMVALYIAPATGLRAEYLPFLDNPVAWALGLLAPWLTLGLVNAGPYTRYARASMIESLGEDYVRTARAKGISERRVVYRHGLRAAVTPLATLFGMDVAFALSGTIFTESIFGLPGLGQLTLRAFAQYDQPVLMGGVLLGATVLVVMNLIVDVMYTILDPRVRLR